MSYLVAGIFRDYPLKEKFDVSKSNSIASKYCLFVIKAEKLRLMRFDRQVSCLKRKLCVLCFDILT